jgi:hypothetical protein
MDGGEEMFRIGERERGCYRKDGGEEMFRMGGGGGGGYIMKSEGFVILFSAKLLDAVDYMCLLCCCLWALLCPLGSQVNYFFFPFLSLLS